MAGQQPPYFLHRFFVFWFLLCAALNVGVMLGFCQWFAWMQDLVLPGADRAALLSACQVTWTDRWFTARYAVAVAAGLGVVWQLVKTPDRGYSLALLYLFTGIILRFMFNVFPHTGPDAGLFPLPPGMSTDPPVYLMPVSMGVMTGFIQIVLFTVLLLQRTPRFRHEKNALTPPSHNGSAA